MPELPEVETVAESLRPRLVGRTVERVETSGFSLRRPVDSARLATACVGARVVAIDRIGKYLLVRLSRGHVLVAHLGMSGRFLFLDGKPGRAPAPRAPHTHVVFHLRGGAELRYVDARRFGVLTAYREEELASSPELGVLGVDPLSPRFTLAWFAESLAGSRRDIKLFLLDQSRVAGLGNIYACEALYEAGISPRRRAGGLGVGRVHRLHAAIRDVLRRSVARRGTTLRDYVDADGAGGDNQNHLAVYGREGKACRCGASIRRRVQGARSTFYCPRCQK